MSTEKSPTLPQEYVKQAAIALQIHHGISHLRTVNPAILTILSTSRSVRAVLLAGDMLLSRMGHAFIAGGDKTANFPLELAAFYVDGRALGAGEKVDANKIRTEVRALNAEQFESDPETAKKWIEALEEAESIVAKIQGEVGRILDESTKTNIIQFVARYGDSTAEKLVGFIETNRGRDAMTQRSEAFIFVKNLIGTDRTVAALPTSARIVLAMSMVELCRVHKFDIMNHYVQGKSAPAFVDDMRKKQIAEFEDGLKKGWIDPKSVMPGVELSPEQATLVLRYILDNPPLRNEDHKAKYAQIAAKLSYAIAQSPNFGTTAAKRTELEQACGKAFTREHYKHFMEFFGYRVAYRDEAA